MFTGEPQWHFDYMSPQKWVGKTLHELHEESEDLRKRLKEASNYFWDSTHYFIDDIGGRPAVEVLFHEDFIHLWNARNGVALSLFRTHDPFSEEDSKALSLILHRIYEGLTQCQQCGEWVTEIKRYSFAGGVCGKCFNPRKHLPPDTHGD